MIRLTPAGGGEALELGAESIEDNAGALLVPEHAVMDDAAISDSRQRELRTVIVRAAEDGVTGGRAARWLARYGADPVDAFWDQGSILGAWLVAKPGRRTGAQAEPDYTLTLRERRIVRAQQIALEPLTPPAPSAAATLSAERDAGTAAPTPDGAPTTRSLLGALIARRGT